MALARRHLGSTAAVQNKDSPPVIQITNGTFYRNYPSPAVPEAANPAYFPNLTWSLPSEKATPTATASGHPQHWAVIGSAGQTSFLEILRGKHIAVPPSSRTYPYLATDAVRRSPARAIQYVGFSGEASHAAGGIRGAYLSARYESLREETDFTVQQYLEGKTELNPLEAPAGGPAAVAADQALLRQVVADLKLKELLGMPVANLSNGQTRRARIAKALLGRPEVLLLDEPFMGLDPPTVAALSPLLHNLAAKSEPRLVISLRPQDAIPEWITHVVFLGPKNTVALQGEKSDVLSALDIWRTVAFESEEAKRQYRGRLPSQGLKDKFDHAQALHAARKFATKLSVLSDVGMVARERRADLGHRQARRDGEPLISMDGVRVSYGDKVVLGDWEQSINGTTKRGLHWQVYRGERWGVFGLNGSGKTTLVSLITSDHPQAYGLPLKLFGRSRLPEPGQPGLSIFDLQRRIGHSSPEVHAFFPRHLSVFRSLATAFADTFLTKPQLNDDRIRDILASLRFFEADLNPYYRPSSIDADCAWSHNVRFESLSTSQQRLVLLLRALVHKPDLVVLDEAFGGMSPSLRDKCLHFIEAGEQHDVSTTGSRRALDHARTWNLPPARPTGEMRFRGLSDQQALVVISHVREEVPDIVGRWMALPSPSAEAAQGMVKQVDEDGRLVYREGVLAENETVAGVGWDRIWGLASP
ncbi:hypothetical protein KEM52_001970 [Ascosphaera acerosa]|nr:hypothetical protein KEM52_001970 [Ascosphaera acerosa]